MRRLESALRRQSGEVLLEPVVADTDNPGRMSSFCLGCRGLARGALPSVKRLTGSRGAGRERPQLPKKSLQT
jgi:hypothetical protein